MIRDDSTQPEIPNIDANDMLLEAAETARQQTISERIEAGIELFGLSCEFMRAGIRLQHPNATDDEIFELVEQRLALARKLEAGR